jgi:hypothetical protein
MPGQVGILIDVVVLNIPCIVINQPLMTTGLLQALNEGKYYTITRFTISPTETPHEPGIEYMVSLRIDVNDTNNSFTDNPMVYIDGAVWGVEVFFITSQRITMNFYMESVSDITTPPDTEQQEYDFEEIIKAIEESNMLLEEANELLDMQIVMIVIIGALMVGATVGNAFITKWSIDK